MHGVLDAGQRLLMIDEKADSERSHEDVRRAAIALALQRPLRGVQL